MKTTLRKQIINCEVLLQRRAVGDQIGTFKAKELGLPFAPQGSAYVIHLDGVTFEAYSNRADGTSLTVKLSNLPRFVKIPATRRPTKVIVRAITRLY